MCATKFQKREHQVDGLVYRFKRKYNQRKQQIFDLDSQKGF